MPEALSRKYRFFHDFFPSSFSHNNPSISGTETELPPKHSCTHACMHTNNYETAETHKNIKKKVILKQWRFLFLLHSGNFLFILLKYISIHFKIQKIKNCKDSHNLMPPGWKQTGSGVFKRKKINKPPAELLCFFQSSHMSPSAPANSSVTDKKHKVQVRGIVSHLAWLTHAASHWTSIPPVGFWTQRTSQCAQWTSGGFGCPGSSLIGSPQGSRDPRKSVLLRVKVIFQLIYCVG